MQSVPTCGEVDIQTDLHYQEHMRHGCQTSTGSSHRRHHKGTGGRYPEPLHQCLQDNAGRTIALRVTSVEKAQELNAQTHGIVPLRFRITTCQKLHTALYD